MLEKIFFIPLGKRVTPPGLLGLLCLPLIFSCSLTKNYQPNKKFSREELQEDYQLLRAILEDKHPALYWYTSKDSMDYYFDRGYNSISDSMTELQFGWRVLAPLTATIRCGHTGFLMSKGWNQFIKGKRIPSFPYHVRVWNDTMMVTHNLNPAFNSVPNGSFITGINGVPNETLIGTLFDHMTTDGYADNVNYYRLSNSFPYFHRNVFGLYPGYSVQYTDSLGNPYSTVVPYFSPTRDTTAKLWSGQVKRPRTPRSQRLKQVRSLTIEPEYAVMTINQFTKGGLGSFFRRSFKDLHTQNVSDLIIDLRRNGGGKLTHSVLLSRYLADKPFKVADSVYSVAKDFQPYSRYISNSLSSNLDLLTLTRKRRDGFYHFGFWERHVFKPKKRHHFSGNVYVLINGFTFSASTLFANSIIGQDNVLFVGEETGGGWYGNSGMKIPNITLPNTRLRVRLPFFKIVQYNHVPEKGSGVLPDVYVGPDWRDVLKGRDTKMEVVKKIIRQRRLNS